MSLPLEDKFHVGKNPSLVLLADIENYMCNSPFIFIG